MKEEKVIICGESGSGKDYLLRGLVKLGVRYKPKFTTRPKRELEKDGVEYNFIDNTTFDDMLNSGDIKTYQKFIINDNTWYYGVSKDNFEKNQAFIMTPHEIRQLSEEDLKDCFVVYLDIDYNIRKSRLVNRKDISDKIERRLKADKIDFQGFDIYDLKVTDPEFESEWVYDLMR